MKVTGIRRNGERMELQYSSEIELEFLKCRYQIVSIVADEATEPKDAKKNIKAPTNRAVKAETLAKR